MDQNEPKTSIGKLRPRPTKNVKFRAVDFRGNFVYLAGSNVNIVTGEMGKIHRKDTEQKVIFNLRLEFEER